MAIIAMEVSDEMSFEEGSSSTINLTLFQTIAELGGRWRGWWTAVFCYKHKLKERWTTEEGEERLRRLQASDTKLVR